MRWHFVRFPVFLSNFFNNLKLYLMCFNRFFPIPLVNEWKAILLFLKIREFLMVSGIFMSLFNDFWSAQFIKGFSLFWFIYGYLRTSDFCTLFTLFPCFFNDFWNARFIEEITFWIYFCRTFYVPNCSGPEVTFHILLRDNLSLTPAHTRLVLWN